MRRPRALRVLAIAALSGVVALAANAAEAGPVVLELFTSQGCSACPPADALLADYADRPGIIALSLPVDYWNYLGWDDTLAKHEHTERQRAYAAERGDGEVYTPQIVVSGQFHVVGSDQAAIDAAIAAAAAAPEVAVSLAVTGNSVHISIGNATAGGPTWGTVWIVLFRNAATVDIARGENAGRTITYRHVVLEMHRLTMWQGAGLTFELPLAEMIEANADGAAVLVQEELNGLPGPIVGAASYSVHAL